MTLQDLLLITESEGWLPNMLQKIDGHAISVCRNIVRKMSTLSHTQRLKLNKINFYTFEFQIMYGDYI